MKKPKIIVAIDTWIKAATPIVALTLATLGVEWAKDIPHISQELIAAIGGIWAAIQPLYVTWRKLREDRA